MDEFILGLSYDTTKARAAIRELAALGAQSTAEVARTAARFSSSGTGRSVLPFTSATGPSLSSRATEVGTLRGILPARGGGTEAERQELYRSGFIASPTTEAVAVVRQGASTLATQLRRDAAAYGEDARETIKRLAQKRELTAAERRSVLAIQEAASVSAETAQTQVTAGRRKAAADTRAAEATDKATADLAQGAAQRQAHLRRAIGGYVEALGLSGAQLRALAGGRAIEGLGGPDLEVLRGTLRAKVERQNSLIQQQIAAGEAAVTAERSFAELQAEAAAAAQTNVQQLRQRVATEEAIAQALFTQLQRETEVTEAIGRTRALKQARAGLEESATAAAFASEPELREAVTSGRVAKLREAAIQENIVAEQLLNREFIATKAGTIIAERTRTLQIEQEVALNTDLIAQRARSAIVEQQARALLANEIRAQAGFLAAQQVLQRVGGVGVFPTRPGGPIIPAGPSSPYGPGGRGPGAAGAAFGGGGFFGGGIRSVVRYGLPGALLFGSISEIRTSFQEATKLQVQLGIIQGTLSSIGREGSTAFGEVRDGIFSVSEATATAASEVANVQRQLAGAFADENLQPDFERAAQESVAAFQLARVAGLPTQEITDSLTAVALAFELPVGAFNEVGDLITGLENRFGVLSAEIVRFVADLAPLGAELGFTAEELAIFGAAAQQASGQSGGALAEQFRRIFASLQERAPDVISLFQSLPDVARQIGEALGSGDIGNVVTLLLQNFDQLDQSQRNTLAALVGGRREAGAFFALLNRGPEIINQLDQGTGEFAGTLESRFDAVRGSLSFTFDQLRRSFEELGFAILDSGIAEGFADVLDAIRVGFEFLATGANVLRTVNDLFGGVPIRIAGMTLSFYALNRALQLVIASFVRTRQEAAATSAQVAQSTAVISSSAATTAVPVPLGRGAGFASKALPALLAGLIGYEQLRASYQSGQSGDTAGYFGSIAAGAATGAVAGSFFPVIGTGLGAIGGGTLAAVAGAFGARNRDRNRTPVALESVYEAEDTQLRLIEEARERQLSVEQALDSYERGIASQATVISAYQAQLRGVQDRIRGASEAGVDTADLEAEAAGIQTELNAFIAGSINERFDAIESINQAFRIGGDPRLTLSLAQARLQELRASGAATNQELQTAAIAVIEAQGALFQQQLEGIEDPIARAQAAQSGIAADANARATLARVAVATLVSTQDLNFLSEFLSTAPQIRQVAVAAQASLNRAQVPGFQGVVNTARITIPGITVSRNQIFDELLQVVLGELELEDTVVGRTVAILRARVRAMAIFAENVARLLGKDSPAFTALRTIISGMQTVLNGIQDTIDQIPLIDIPEQITDLSQGIDAGDAADLAREIAEAKLNLAEALAAGDPIKEALIAQQRADVALQFAENEADRINALADRIRADQQLQEAIDDIFNSRTELAISVAQAAGDDVLAAELAYKQSLDAIQQAQERGAGEAELNRLQGEANAAQRASQDAFLNDKQEYYQYLHDIGQITDRQLIGYLEALLAIPTITEDQRRDITRQIHQLREDLGRDFQFNLPSQLGLPTFYEVSRVGQLGEAGGGGGYNDNRVITVNVSAQTNASPEDISNEVVRALGDPRRSGTYTRRY